MVCSINNCTEWCDCSLLEIDKERPGITVHPPEDDPALEKFRPFKDGPPPGGKGEVHDESKCKHDDPNDGCEWCCNRCNFDTHFCPGCGTVTGHQDEACDHCA